MYSGHDKDTISFLVDLEDYRSSNVLRGSRKTALSISHDLSDPNCDVIVCLPDTGNIA